MIFADITMLGECEPFVCISFEESPAVGDRLWIVESQGAPARMVEVLRRDWYASAHRQSTNHTVILRVRDVEDDS